MFQSYFVLKEYFKTHDYPLDLLNPILSYYLNVYNFEFFIEGIDNSSIIRTPNNEIHYWNVAGDHRKIDLPHVKKIIHGDCCAFAITENNDLYSWGSNENGRLGIDLPVKKYLNDQVKQATKVELSNIKDVVCIDKCVYAITIDGDVWYWGTNHDINKPRKYSLIHVKHLIDDKRLITITDKDELYCVRDKVKIYNVKEAFVFESRVIALTIFGELFHFSKDQAPRKIDLPNINKVICDEPYHKVILISGSDVYLWSFHSETLTQVEISNVKDVSHGGDYYLSLTYNHDAYSCGNNACGQLGTGIYNNATVPQKIISNVRKILCGGYSSFAVTHNNELYAWGNSNYGQLGLGNNKIFNGTIEKVQIEYVKDICYSNYCLLIVTWFGEIYYCGKWHDQSTDIPKKLFF